MKVFELAHLLSVTTGVLCTESIDGVYEILDFVTGDSLFTHQLPRAADQVKPFLLGQFPFLNEISPNMVAGDDCYAKVEALTRIYGNSFNVHPLHQEYYQSIDPIQELEDMGLGDKLVVIRDQDDLDDLLKSRPEDN